MNKDIEQLSDQLHDLYKKLMTANPWDQGYGEVVAIHEYLIKVLRDKAQKSFDQFKVYLAESAKEIEETWTSSKSAFGPWSKELRPIFETIEKIISHSVPLIALL